ncbi:MAG: zinc metallopeptidase [Eubacteriales bacterium]
MGWMLYPDYYYVILVLPAFLLAMIAQIYLKSIYKKMSRVFNTRGITGAQAALSVLNHFGINNVSIEPVAGTLSDHFDPRSNVIRLSQGVYESNSIAAIGIACHEAGHAAQHNENYFPIKIRNTILPVANIGSALGLPLAILGYFMSFGPLIAFGLILYSLIAVFQIVTLPVEFNASGRAIKVIDEVGLLNVEEQAGAQKVLKAAAFTYVAALAVTLANLLRFILRFSGRR